MTRAEGAAAVVVWRPLATSEWTSRHPEVALLSGRLPIIGTAVPARTGRSGNTKARRQQQESSACRSERRIHVSHRGAAGLDPAARPSRHAGPLDDAAASGVGCFLRNIGHSQAVCECRDTQGIHVIFVVVVDVDAVLHDVH